MNFLIGNSTLFPLKNLSNIQGLKKTEVSFKGNDNDNKTEGCELPYSNYTSVSFHPAALLTMQLIKDGYKKSQISDSNIFYDTKLKDIDFSYTELVQSALDGIVSKKDIFSRKLKSPDDIKAMQKAYVALKEKFDTPDVREHIAEMQKIEDDIASFIESKGICVSKDSNNNVESMILSVLHYVNKDNEPLLQELLNDENFNNVQICSALMTIDDNKDVRCSLDVLHKAQRVGYKKEFSFPLSVMISESNPRNMKMIEKMLGEQDFLSENSDFVANKLMGLLRNAGRACSSIAYETDTAVTLKEANELFDIENS